MPGNNPNQNPSLDYNRAKRPVRGFPGMKGHGDMGHAHPAEPEEHGDKERSLQEVAEARMRNAGEGGEGELPEPGNAEAESEAALGVVSEEIPIGAEEVEESGDSVIVRKPGERAA